MAVEPFYCVCLLIDDKLHHNIVKVAVEPFLCVCPLIDDKLHHNIVKVAVEPVVPLINDKNQPIMISAREIGQLL